MVLSLPLSKTKLNTHHAFPFLTNLSTHLGQFRAQNKLDTSLVARPLSPSASANSSIPWRKALATMDAPVDATMNTTGGAATDDVRDVLGDTLPEATLDAIKICAAAIRDALHEDARVDAILKAAAREATAAAAASAEAAPAEPKRLTYPAWQSGSPNPERLLDEKPLPPLPFRTPSFAAPPAASLGTLTLLPQELLDQVLSHVDMSSLAAFSLANRRAAHAVSALPALAIAARRAPLVLRSVRAIRVAPQIAPAALLAALQRGSCEDCGAPAAPLLYLLAGPRRVCVPCLELDARYLPLTPAYAAACYGLESAAGLRRMRAVGGAYGPVVEGEAVAEGEVLVDRRAAIWAGIVRHGSMDRMERFVARRTVAVQHELWLMGDAWEEVYPPGALAPRVEVGAADPPHEWADTPLRYVAAVRAPWLRGRKKEVKWGLQCEACRGCRLPQCHESIVYTEESYEENHLRYCGKTDEGILDMHLVTG